MRGESSVGLFYCFIFCYLLFYDPYPFVDVILDVSVEYIRTVILYEQVSNHDNLEEEKIYSLSIKILSWDLGQVSNHYNLEEEKIYSLSNKILSWDLAQVSNHDN
jgi:hypothetical protein